MFGCYRLCCRTVRCCLQSPSRVIHVPRRLIRNKASDSGQNLSNDPFIHRAQSANIHGSAGKEIFKNFIFTTVVGGGCFVGCIIWQHERMEKQAREIAQWYQNKPLSDYEIPLKYMEFRQRISTWWNSLPEDEKWKYFVVGINVVVFGMWRVNSLHNLMCRYFCSMPKANPLSSNFLSMFSHHSFVHILCNMFVFASFVPAVVHSLGVEQSAALYLTGGLVASFSSTVYKLLRGGIKPSLGASGAILCYLGFVCTHMPESRLSILFVDRIYPHSFTAKQGLTALIIFDTVGLLLGWTVFDHAAHLGGVLFGLWYANYGRKWIWDRRHRVKYLWRKMKGP